MQRNVVPIPCMVYGATPAARKARGGFFFQRGLRARLNVVPVVLSVFVPWLMFVLLVALISRPTHFERPLTVESVVTASTILVAFLGVRALLTMRRKAVHPDAYEPNWMCTFFILMLLALTLASSIGEAIYLYGYFPYLSTKALGAYNDVDPSKTSGAQLMDAGVINFMNESVLNLDLSMGFWNVAERYCVAPIVRPGADSASYDFWAVGMDCCDKGTDANFHCPHFSSEVAHSGYRLTADDARPFYRMAVQQSEAAFGITANHPLFFLWSDNATEDLEGYRVWADEAMLIGIFGHFVLNSFLVVCMAILFTKVGHY